MLVRIRSTALCGMQSPLTIFWGIWHLIRVIDYKFLGALCNSLLFLHPSCCLAFDAHGTQSVSRVIAEHLFATKVVGIVPRHGSYYYRLLRTNQLHCIDVGPIVAYNSTKYITHLDVKHVGCVGCSCFGHSRLL